MNPIRRHHRRHGQCQQPGNRKSYKERTVVNDLIRSNQVPELSWEEGRVAGWCRITDRDVVDLTASAMKQRGRLWPPLPLGGLRWTRSKDITILDESACAWAPGHGDEFHRQLQSRYLENERRIKSGKFGWSFDSCWPRSVYGISVCA
jgi:hypothetical protein